MMNEEKFLRMTFLVGALGIAIIVVLGGSFAGSVFGLTFSLATIRWYSKFCRAVLLKEHRPSALGVAALLITKACLLLGLLAGLFWGGEQFALAAGIMTQMPLLGALIGSITSPKI